MLERILGWRIGDGRLGMKIEDKNIESLGKYGVVLKMPIRQ